MRLKKVILKKFKRFDDLTIELWQDPKKIIALVWPNGSGKSSVIDAFAPSYNNQNYNNKKLYDESWDKIYRRNDSINIVWDDNSSTYSNDKFYVRSSQRFTENVKFQFNQWLKVSDDPWKPNNSWSIDSRMNQNYNLLMMDLIKSFQQWDETWDQARAKYIDRINLILESILEIRIASLADVTNADQSDLYFDKWTSKGFPYRNLSAWEKAIVDLIIDLVLKVDVFDNNVFLIDEPELHINTWIQRKLIIELEKLIPEGSQLWIATHSIWFLRAFQNELNEKTDIISMWWYDFDNKVILAPIVKSRKMRQGIFSPALDDLTWLVAPSKIIYCEWKPLPWTWWVEKWFDALVYNTIFEKKYPDVIFVSSDWCWEVAKYSWIALLVLQKAFIDSELVKLIDRDSKTHEELEEEKACWTLILLRHEIENYLLDKEVICSFLVLEWKVFDEDHYNSIIPDIVNWDVKNKVWPLAQKYWYWKDAFLEWLINAISSDMIIYSELEGIIFQ